MLVAIVAIIVILFLAGQLHFPITIPDITIFSIAGRSISLFNFVIFCLVLWVIKLLPRPFREIVTVILLLWTLSIFGIIAVTGLSNILIIAIVLGLIFYLFK